VGKIVRISSFNIDNDSRRLIVAVMKNQKLLSTRQLAAEIERPVSAVQRWARMRLIPSIRIGWRTQYFDPEAVRRALLKKTIRELE